MEWPKRARTVNWESGVLTLDGEKQFEIPELTAEIMEQLAAYTLVGFHVKGYSELPGAAVPGHHPGRYLQRQVHRYRSRRRIRSVRLHHWLLCV